nr:MAG TPA: hypothetical protein [Caudoviricetes sp.]
MFSRLILRVVGVRRFFFKSYRLNGYILPVAQDRQPRIAECRFCAIYLLTLGLYLTALIDLLV